MEKDVVFKVLAEGGSICIYRTENKKEQGFIYTLAVNEFHFLEEDLVVDDETHFEAFYSAFDALHKKYEWHNLHLKYVDPDFREYVAEALVDKLNTQEVKKLRNQNRISDLLNGSLYLQSFDVEDTTGLQKITVERLVKMVEHQYDEYFVDRGNDIIRKYKLVGTYEMWSEKQPFNSSKTQIIDSDNMFEVIGYVEVVPGSIIIKNKKGQITYVMPADKYFISTEPFLIEKEIWKFDSFDGFA